MSTTAIAHGGREKPGDHPLTDDSRKRFGRRWSAAVALLTYTGLAVAMFSSTWVHPTTWAIGGTYADAIDATWFLGWPQFAITHGQSLFFSNYINYPDGINLMWNGSMLLTGLVLAPLIQVGGFVLAYNVLMTMAVALSAWTAYLLIRRYVSSQVAAGVGGLLYGFSPFMTAHSLAHPVLTVAFMAPILLMLLDEIVRAQRRRPLVSGFLLGLAATAQLFIGEEVLVSTAVVGLLLICVAAALCPDQVASHIKHAVLGLAAAAITFAVLAAAPVVYQLFGPQHVLATVQQPNKYVSDVLGFFIPSRNFLLAPERAGSLAHRFTPNVVEDNSYIGVLLALLLAFIVVRYWPRLEVRIAALGAVLIAILSMGITIHFVGRVTPIPVFAIGLVFPFLRRYLPGWWMLFITIFGWLMLSRVPALDNLLPTRLMLHFYLFAGLLLAVWLDDMRAWQPRLRLVGWLAAAASLALLVPILPYPSTSRVVPAFFAGGAVSRIPDGSVALVVPFAGRANAQAMMWQERAGLRFRMPEGYAIIPDALPAGVRVGPPPSTTQTQINLASVGRADPLTDATRQEMLSELSSWHVQTVIVGPMPNEQLEVDLFTSALGRAPDSVDGVYVWWGVNP